MSYSHTKRRKTVKRLKNKTLRWRDELTKIGDEVRKKNDGPFLGSLGDLIGI